MEAGGHRGAFQAENAKDFVGLFDPRITKCCEFKLIHTHSLRFLEPNYLLLSEAELLVAG